MSQSGAEVKGWSRGDRVVASRCLELCGEEKEVMLVKSGE